MTISLAFTNMVPFVWAHSVKVIGARVAEVQLDKKQLTLVFQHPVTQKDEQLILEIGNKTDFSENLHLEDLRPNEPVSVDYEEKSEGKGRAVLIKRVPVRAPNFSC